MIENGSKKKYLVRTKTYGTYFQTARICTHMFGFWWNPHTPAGADQVLAIELNHRKSECLDKKLLLLVDLSAASRSVAASSDEL